jgi:ubiquinone biosynthesis protein COQ4
VGIGLTQLGEPEAVRVMLDGFRRGTRAAWLPATPWEKLLPLPLDHVRARLRIDAPPRYAERRSSQLRAEGKIPLRDASPAA